MAIEQRIVSTSKLEPRDDVDEKLHKQYASTMALAVGLTGTERMDAYNKTVARGTTFHDDVQQGLLYATLMSASQAELHLNDLILCNRDGFHCITNKLSQVIHEKWIKLTNSAKQQVVWVVRQMADKNISGADAVCKILLRQIAGGDVSYENLRLADHLLNIFIECRPWLDANPQLISMCVFTYLRVLVDHSTSQYEALRNKEADFIAHLLKEKFTECMSIGRDLVRLLQAVARIPQFQEIWQVICCNPSTLSPKFTGVAQLMRTRTPRKFLASRLTPDMEIKLGFLMNKVKFQSRKRYQDWFHKRYLSTPESQTLRYDLIRFICVCHHPTNEMLQSDIVPRWAVIGWLLQTCTSNVAAANSKLCLFFDWLFFDAEKDNIMNIEPAILVMHHSLRGHLAKVTATLLDFLCRILPNFYPPLTTQIKMGINTSFKMIVSKGVLQNLSHLFDSARLDKELRANLRECFPEFSSAQMPVRSDEESTTRPSLPDATERESDHGGFSDDEELSIPPPTPPPPASTPAPAPASVAVSIPSPSSGPKVGTAGKPPALGSGAFKPIDSAPPALSVAAMAPAPTTGPVVEDLDEVLQLIEKVEPQYGEFAAKLFHEKDEEDRCEIMESLIQILAEIEDYESDKAGALAAALLPSLRVRPTVIHEPLDEQFKAYSDLSILPLSLDAESLADSVGSPIFVLFRNLSQISEESPSRDPLLVLLHELYRRYPAVGYLLIYFLKIGKTRDESMRTYRDLISMKESSTDLTQDLIEDLDLCYSSDCQLFGFLLPEVFNQFPTATKTNPDFIHLVISSLDSKQLQDIQCEILQSHITLFTDKDILPLLEKSLDWETTEQMFLWQLVESHHDITVEHLLPLIPRLEYKRHHEASSAMLRLLLKDGPTAESLRVVLCRPCTAEDRFTLSIIKCWSGYDEEKLSDLLATSLNKGCSTPKKRTGRAGRKEQPTMEGVLSHLKQVLQYCKNIEFLANETLQSALTQSMNVCTDAQKTQYSELFALVEDIEEGPPAKRALRQTAARRANNASPHTSTPSSVAHKKRFSDSSNTDSEDDDKPKSKRRRKNPVVYIEDSD